MYENGYARVGPSYFLHHRDHACHAVSAVGSHDGCAGFEEGLNHFGRRNAHHGPVIGGDQPVKGHGTNHFKACIFTGSAHRQHRLLQIGHRFHDNGVGTPGLQRQGLLPESLVHFISRHFLHDQHLPRGPYRSQHQYPVTGRLTADRRGSPVQFRHLPGQPILLQLETAAPKTVGLDQVGPRLHITPGNRQHIIAMGHIPQLRTLPRA